MKKILTSLLLLILSVILSSCLDKIKGNDTDKYDVKETDDFKYMLVHNDETDAWNRYAIGDVFSKKEAVFIPQKIHNIPVEVLGMKITTNITRTDNLRTFKGERIYLPNSIEEWHDFYIHKGSIDIFYCGKIRYFFDMIHHYYIGTVKIYIPYESVEDYCKLHEENDILLENIYYIDIANVSYYLNYPDGIYEYNEFHYIDFYENGEKIIYIPPIPEKEGYIFGGWYKEAECINKWDFKTDTIIYTEDNPVTKLYAKWI